MNDRPVVTARVFVGLVVLTLGVLWTLDNLGMMDASRIVRWWPMVALVWGFLHLVGLGVRRRVSVGSFWLIIGAVSLLNTLDVMRVTIFDLWPVFLLVIGGSMIMRGWRGTSWVSGSTEAGSRINASAMMAGAERKVVAQDFQGGDLHAVMGGLTVDLRSARLANNRAVLDVFAMWGGIEILVPDGWGVTGEVTPILGAFQDTTAPPTDPNAPMLVVRGEVVMGGIEVMNESRLRKRMERYENLTSDPDTGEPIEGVRVGPGGVFIGGIRARRRGRRGVYGIEVGRGGVVIQHGDPRETPAEPRPSGQPGQPGQAAPPAGEA